MLNARRFEEIRAIPLFAGVNDESFAQLVRGAYVQNFPPHTELITEGEPADFLHIVVSGCVELVSSWQDRETQHVIPAGKFDLHSGGHDQGPVPI